RPLYWRDKTGPDEVARATSMKQRPRPEARGRESQQGIDRSVITSRHRLGPVMIAVRIPHVAMSVAIGAPNGQRILPIRRIRREPPGTGIGRALIDEVVLRCWFGETFKGPPATPATRISVVRHIAAQARANIRSAAAAKTASKSGRNARRHHGNRRD